MGRKAIMSKHTDTSVNDTTMNGFEQEAVQAQLASAVHEREFEERALVDYEERLREAEAAVMEAKLRVTKGKATLTAARLVESAIRKMIDAAEE
jgi:hypothetical protein